MHHRLTKPLLLVALAIACLALPSTLGAADAEPRHRLLVLTDIENEPDDTQSMVRLLLYSDLIDLEGLVATTSIHLKDRVHPDSLRSVIGTYGAVRDNLLLHSPGFPPADRLLSLVKQGLPVYGMQGVGTARDSEGSDWIIQVLKKDDPRPLWVSVWGGANTLAQALFKLRATETEAELQRLVSKLRVYTISDQDDSGAWLRSNFPDLFYIVSPGGYGAATWTGMHMEVPGLDNSSVSNAWLAQHIQQGHGPLGAKYPDVGYGMEGDTPAWLALIPNGLSVPERPDWGGWGGRYILRTPALAETEPTGFTGGVPVNQETRPIWTNAIDDYTPPTVHSYGAGLRPGTKSFKDYKATVYRWRDDFQNDFAARMDWTTKPVKEANHAPIPRLAHPNTLNVKPGDYLMLDARPSSDPDGDSLSYHWFVYPEAGSSQLAPKFQGSINLSHVGLRAPQVSKPETLHVILRLTDKGTPALSRYQRIIVTITP